MEKPKESTAAHAAIEVAPMVGLLLTAVVLSKVTIGKEAAAAELLAARSVFFAKTITTCKHRQDTSRRMRL